MRIGVISDIHGNLVALDTVLSALERHKPNSVVCLGDVAADGPDPLGCLRRLRELGCDMVMGNTDADLLFGRAQASEDEDWQKFFAIEAWAMDRLSEADKTFMESFQSTVTVSLTNELEALCYHGSPRSFNDILRADTPEGTFGPWFDGVDATLLIGGHTHGQMARRWKDRLLVNPGSVGMPFEMGKCPLWAEYAVINIQGRQPTVTLCRTPVDFVKLKASVEHSDMPHAGWWLSNWE